MPVETDLLGARVVTEGRTPYKADLCFVHGLCGHPIRTWSTEDTRQKKPIFKRFFKSDRNNSPAASDSQQQKAVFWPQQLLADEIPNVRILTFGYNSEVVRAFAAVGQNNIFQHAENLLNEMKRIRTEDPQRPVIFVCHSLGGIIVKETLRRSRAATYQPEVRALYEATHGVIFLGTPHRGTTWAPWGALMGNLAKVALQSPNTAQLRALEVDSMALQMIADDFSTMIREDIAVYSFREEKPMTGLYGLHDKIVDDFSSIIGDATEGKEGIDANHRDMCKFSSKHDAGYRKVSGEIHRFVSAASRPAADQSQDNVQDWPVHISAVTRQKILRDALHNHLSFARGSNTVRLPVFTDQALFAPSDYAVPPNLYLGCSAFELAHTLLLLDRQANSQLMTFESIHLQHIVVDSNTYYSKISQRGLLRLICDHFYSAAENVDNLSLRTDIGTFSFGRTEGCTSIRFSASQRSHQRLSPGNQDFDALRKCALGEYCRRTNINNAKDLAMLPVGPPEWMHLDIDLALSVPDLEHPNCIRFMLQRDYDELGLQYDFAEKTLQDIFLNLEPHLEAFDVYTQQGLGTLQLLCDKDSGKPDRMSTVAPVVRWVLGGIIRAPPRTASLSETAPIGATARPRQFTADLAVHTPSRFVDAAMQLRSEDRHVPEAANQNVNTGQRLLMQASDTSTTLLALFRSSQDMEPVRERITQIGQTRLDIHVALALVQIICKTNAKTIRTISAPVPLRWLQLLEAPDAEILIG